MFSRIRGGSGGRRILCIQISILAIALGSFSPLEAADARPFPRLAALQVGGWGTGYDHADIDTIAKADVAMIGLFRNHNVDGHTANGIVTDIKRQNPDIILLQYTIVSTMANSQEDLVSILEAQKGPAGQGDWFARDTSGNKTSEWPNQSNMNITRFVTPDANGDRVPQWLSKVMNKQLWELAPFDGVFIDVMRPRPQVVADWDGDGVNDSKDEAAPWYSRGQRDFFDAHQAAWPEHVMTANITRWAYDPIPDYYRGILHGGLMEGIIGKTSSPHVWGGWGTMMDKYREYMEFFIGPRYGVFHSIGAADDYQFTRYTLASCLMDDGYYAHTTSELYNETVWFDEYDIDLGVAIDQPQTSAWQKGVYRRQFSKGIALVNPEGNGDQTVDVGPGYKRFVGAQDPAHNNGKVVQTLTLKEGDGILLLAEDSAQVKRPKPPSLN